MMKGRNLSNGMGKIKVPPARLSREEKIKVLAAIQEFGLGTSAEPEVPVNDLDQVYHLANRWRAELERCTSGHRRVVFVNFGQKE